MEDLLLQLADNIQNKYYGKYRGFVKDNKDPEKRGRLKLQVPSTLGETVTEWALPCLPFGGLADQGWFTVPELDAQVWVEFEEGNLSQPLWTGTFWQNQGDPPAEATTEEEPTTRMLKTPSGHMLRFHDKEGEEQIHLEHPTGSNAVFDEKGNIALTDSGGSTVKLDADKSELSIVDTNGNSITMSASGTVVEDSNGNKIEMAGAGITVTGQQIVLKGSQVMLAGQGGEPVIKGQSFLTLFATHIHPTGVGPSGPPIPQGEMSTLSMKTTTA